MQTTAARGMWWLAILGVIVFLAGIGLVGPQIRGKEGVAGAVPDRNLVNTTDRNLDLGFTIAPVEKNVLWKATLGKEAHAGPVIAGGKVFVCTNNENPRDRAVKGDCGVVMCFDAKKGEFLWQITHNVLADNEQNHPRQGIASTPWVDGDRLYYVSNRCELVCADVNGDPKKPGKGKVLWTYDMIKELNVYPSQLAASSPIVCGDMVYVLTGNGVSPNAPSTELPSPEAPSFIAVDKNSGKLQWKDASPGKNVMEGQWAGPAIVAPKGGKPQAIFPGGDGWLYSFEAHSGKPLWKFNCNPKDATFNIKRKDRSDKAYFLASPVVYQDRVYIGIGRAPDDGAGVGHLWCIDPTKTGDVSPKDEKFDPKDPKNKDSALVWHYGGRIDPEPARPPKFIFGRTLSTCAIHDGLLYVADLEGFFHCLDAGTGKRCWTADLDASCWCSPSIIDNKVFIGNDDGDLIVFAAGKEKKQITKINIGPPVRKPVKVVDGVLYLVTNSELFAVKVK